jgi:hypothetical protein
VRTAQIFSSAVRANDEIAALDGLPGDNLRQGIPKRVVANYANDDGRERIGKRLAGLLHELEEIKQVGSFDLIFRESVLRVSL